jgi:hypothetical protein
VGASMAKFNYETAMREGHGFNLYVADLLQTFGVPNVVVPEFSMAATYDERINKTLNEKDIVIDDLVLEIKSSSRSFKNADDFPHNPLIVDTVHGYDSKVIKPWAYVIISQITRGIFVIPTATKQYWTITTFYDAQRDIEDRFYMTSKRHCRPFLEMVDLLLERAHERTNQM